MTSGFRNSAGVDFDDLYDPDVQGDGYTATFLRRSGGTALKYASASYGTPGDVVGFRDGSGVDVGPRWAKKGTAQYGLPINGQTYTASVSGLPGSAALTFRMSNDGTYAIIREIRGAPNTLASGTWLPSGDAVANFTCTFSMAQTINQQTADGYFVNSNSAATQQALTTTQNARAESDTLNSGDRASQTVTVQMKLYRAGVLKSTTTVTFNTAATAT